MQRNPNNAPSYPGSMPPRQPFPPVEPAPVIHQPRKKSKLRRFFHFYFLASGIAANLILFIWAVVRLLVKIQSFQPNP